MFEASDPAVPDILYDFYQYKAESCRLPEVIAFVTVRQMKSKPPKTVTGVLDREVFPCLGVDGSCKVELDFRSE
jgi:hypothetical protein